MTQTFVYEPIQWLRAMGHHVEVVTEVDGVAPGVEDRASRVIGPWLTQRRKAQLLTRRLSWSMRMSIRAWRARGTHELSWAELAARASLPEIRRAQVLFAHFGPVGAVWLPVARMAQRPLTVFIHGGFDTTPTLRAEPNLYDDLFASNAIFLTNSEYIKSWLLEAGALKDRVRIVRLAATPSLAAAPQPLLCKPRVLTIARLVAMKGLEESIGGFAQAGLAAKRWHYEIIGDGPLASELREKASLLGMANSVEFLGYLPRAETLAALQRASIFVLASRIDAAGNTEGTPVSIIEAASLGLPVVATQHAGIPEILPPEAEARGFLVPEGDVQALASAMARLANDPNLRRRWGSACRDYARARFSVDQHVSELLAAFDHAMAQETR